MPTIERTRTAVRSYASLSDDELKKLVGQAQADFATQKPTLKVQLEAFSLEMHFELPGEVTDTQLLTREGNTVSLTLDGKKAFVALDKFMADDGALAATFKKGEDSPANDDIMLASMYGQKGPMSARVKLTSETKAAFDYHTEARVAQLAQADMLKQAGVELIPRFIVNDTQPATTSKPASRPAPGRGR